MLATQEQAGTVRPANEVQKRPAGEVPVKPTASWLRNLRHSAALRYPEVSRVRRRNSSTRTQILPQYTAHAPRAISGAGLLRVNSPRRRTVGVETKIVRRLLNPERGTIHELGIQNVDGQFNDKEAEKQYKELIRQLRVWSLDSAHPENDPLHEFNEYHTFTFKRVYRKINIPNKEAELRPYICFIGFNSEEEVKRAHAKLASKKVQSRHCPLLGLCYDLDWEQLSGMPRATLLRDAQQHTLCGSLVSIGEGPERRVVTIGGLVTDGEVTWALTAGHLPKEVQRSRSDSETLTENDLELSEYSEDVKPPLVILPAATSSDSDLDPLSLDKPQGPTPAELGDIDISGKEWSLIRLKDNTLALPNCAMSEDQQPVYLFKYAETLLPPNSVTDHLDATVIGGVTGPSQVRLLGETSPMRLPRGKWIDAWVAEAHTESQLKRGDSGSWVVNIQNGIVYGHVLSVSGKSIYILSLTDIFQDVSAKHPSLRLDIVHPFTSLERLALTYYSRRNYFKSKYYAEQALQTSVIRDFQEKSAENTDKVDKFIQWASKEFGLGVVDFRYSNNPPPGSQLQWDWAHLPVSELPGNLDAAPFDNIMTAPGTSQASIANRNAQNLHGGWGDFDKLEEARRGKGRDVDFALGTPISEYLFLKRIGTLQTILEPASCLELWNYSDPNDSVLVEEHQLNGSDLELFLSGKGPFNHSNSLNKSEFLNGLRLVTQRNVNNRAFSYDSINLQPDTYKFLVQELKLPLIATEAFSAVGAFFWWTYNIHLEDPYLQIIFRKPGEFEIILSYSAKTRITSGYMRSIDNAAIRRLLEQLMRFSKPSAHPLMLPILVLLSILGIEGDTHYRNTRDRIRTIESAMRRIGAQELESLFKDAVECQRLVLEKRPQSWLHIINKVTEAMDCYWTLLDETHKTPEQKELHKMLMDRLSFLSRKLESAGHYVHVSSERANRLVEFIQFMHAAKDSQINRDILTVLKYRKKNSGRSSEAQLTILVAVFLPGILVASLFSTSFFDFTNGIRGPVSNKLWIYFVIVVPLTVVVLGAWWIYNRRAAARAELGTELDEKPETAAGAGRTYRPGLSAYEIKV